MSRAIVPCNRKAPRREDSLQGLSSRIDSVSKPASRRMQTDIGRESYRSGGANCAIPALPVRITKKRWIGAPARGRTKRPGLPKTRPAGGGRVHPCTGYRVPVFALSRPPVLLLDGAVRVGAPRFRLEPKWRLRFPKWPFTTCNMDISVTEFKARCLDLIRRVEKTGGPSSSVDAGGS